VLVGIQQEMEQIKRRGQEELALCTRENQALAAQNQELRGAVDALREEVKALARDKDDFARQCA
jgi:chromosome segregation ATPase